MRILISDDHALVREGLKLVLQRMETKVCVIECENYSEVLEQAAHVEDIDLALIDLRMPDMNGMDSVSEFHEKFPDIPVIVFSGRYSLQDIFAAFKNGAVGFVPKNMTNKALIGAIQLVLNGELYVPPETLSATQVSIASSRGSADTLDETNPLRLLTDREREALAELIKGQQNKVIAANLGIQEVTVKLHLKNIYKKLGAANRTQAVKTALDFGWEC